MTEVHPLWFVSWCKNVWLYTRHKTEFSSQLGYSMQNTCPRRYVKGTSLGFKSRTLSSHFFQSRSAENQTSKRSSVFFYWESLSNRWVLSNTLMNTICSLQYFANRQHYVVNFHLIAETGPMNSSHGETSACTSRRDVCYDFRPHWFRGTTRMEQIHSPATWLFL